jgi:hypothetical protein
MQRTFWVPRASVQHRRGADLSACMLAHEGQPVVFAGLRSGSKQWYRLC